MIRFGPAGNSESFYNQGYKSSVQMPEWLRKMGLGAYEYSCSKGVKIGRQTAEQIGEQARLNDIFVSIHAPYYINLANEEPEKRERSRQYILETMQAAKWMGAQRIVVHTGACSKITRETALKLACGELALVLAEADAAGLGDVHICPEVLGKRNQLGNLEEIIEMCTLDERLIPTIDFGHLHARSNGGYTTTEHFANVLEAIENRLGNYRMRSIHSHFSRIEFTASGEKRHWTLADVQFGPEFEPLAEALLARNAEPVMICESRDNMAEDALAMQNIYRSLAGGKT
ncbi:MAG: TIM barrel protein [Clostridiales bacterium]|nr:TIM barrel protein [Clostridiales bacterium]